MSLGAIAGQMLPGAPGKRFVYRRVEKTPPALHVTNAEKFLASLRLLTSQQEGPWDLHAHDHLTGLKLLAVSSTDGPAWETLRGAITQYGHLRVNLE